ncbi:AfsR/SARP family transcriptional regulator [Actinomadura opuntiae]|uniref:AfsR/SARP family transcriptional regulator n=1 Tax=Actinomadura sp. OS1-43 TaxID=604315 RepID=UPI00255B3B5E|nr:BTAD domain-containing putative transcriptional regulator [Actinomadura sp. OS1-43]MDL4815150.1 BTAD domain-containing putative transcriptional regulator [Actinomadura sp. OS1-43]
MAEEVDIVPDVRFTLFGRVGATAGGRPLDLGARQSRCLLAVLLLADGPVHRDRLVDSLWEEPSDGANQDLYRLVGRLKKTLAGAGLDGALECRDGLYRLTVPPGSLDVARFRDLVRRAAAEDDERAAALLEEAMRVAADEPLADLVGLRMDAQRQGLVEERRAARLELERVSLRLGRHQARIPALAAAFRADRADEAMAGLLMIALYRAGRQNEAMAVYGEVREHLDEVGGVGVGRELACLYERMIRNELDEAVPDPQARTGRQAPRGGTGPGDTGPGRDREPERDREPRRRAADRDPAVHNEFKDKVIAPNAVFGISNHYGREGR